MGTLFVVRSMRLRRVDRYAEKSIMPASPCAPRIGPGALWRNPRVSIRIKA